MPVYFTQEAGAGRAVWRADDATEDVPLCSVALDAYDSQSEVRDRFAALVNAVANYYRGKHVAGAVAPTSRLAGFPCETCTAPEADDVRFRAGQISDVNEFRLSPGGFPQGCCKVKTVAAFRPTGQDVPVARG